MQGSVDDFKRHYEGLSDEALAAINRDELVDLARLCFDAEMARRSIPVEQVVTAEELPESDGTLVTVQNYGWIEEARSAEGLLRSMGIDCFIKNENILRIDPLVWMDRQGGLCLMVSEADAERAREVLATRISDEDLASQAEAAGTGGLTE